MARSMPSYDETMLKPLPSMISILDAKFTTWTPLQLKFKPHLVSWSIVDAATDELYFRSTGAWSTRRLLDQRDNVVAVSKVHFFTMEHRRDVYTTDKRDLCVMSCSVSSASSRLNCLVVVTITRQQYSFDVEGNWKQRQASIRCNDHIVAKTKRQSWLQNDLQVEIVPGMDAAFIALLCLMLERAARDDHRRRLAGMSGGLS
ncbi:hypothetical protein Ae201684P_000612 [Aphanomyces euteiches]|uniref:Tubby C-terminal domain-containing protein n=1 Tax=Aphanomyces euteiches TaxID=100861 RepID=A0A6G0W7E3_9STRA|nr:hypothetical protein Ae201684_017924 [Aphanomyces euteiches]KAH9087200.1 hypothetical protein Ae201684P_000612 [Aphanomyces euteiches]KAH9137988.1 hypothetical protein AeRB84_017556 [Aphanomyces euteiches]